MGAHVPAVGQQRHGMRHQPDRDLENHHRGRDPNHNSGPPFRVRKIGNEIVRLAKLRMISPVHQTKPTAISNSYPQKSQATVP